MYYRENKELSADTKQAYIDGLNSLLARRQALSRQQRDSYCKDFFRGRKSTAQLFGKRSAGR